MRKTGASIAAGLALVIAMGLTGCGKAKWSYTVQGTNVLHYAMQSRPTTMDPALVEDGDTIDLLVQVFEGLVYWSEKNEIVGQLAEKWEVSDDGKTYTFHLRPGVKFHKPFERTVTAADFVYSLTRALTPATKSPTAMNYLNDIVGARELADGAAAALPGVRAIDDNTLQIQIKARTPYFLGKLTYPTGVVVCREAIQANNGTFDERAMVGTGPFAIADYRLAYSVTLAANPAYWAGKPALDGIERPILADSSARQNRYEGGGLDMTDVQRADLDRIKADPVLSGQLREFPRANVWYLALNQRAFKPFADRRVRRAFAMAIDRDALIKLALRDSAQRAEGIVPPGVPGFVRSAKPFDISYDPAAARALLAQAGFPEGKGFPQFKITFRQGYKYVEDAVLAIRADLKRNLGIEADVQQMEWTTFLTERGKGTMPCFHLRWSADYLDPQNFLSLMLHTGSSENSIGYSNPEFDRLCDQADSEADQARRMKLYQQAEKIAVEDAPWVPLHFLRDVELQKPYLKGLRDSVMGHLPHTTTTVVH